MRLILIRHGDPDYEHDALTETGHKQALLLGEAMKDIKINKLFVSPMGRAKMTCAYIEKSLGISATVLPWLHELDGNYKDNLWAWNYHPCTLLDKNINWSIKEWSESVPYGKHITSVADEFYSNFDDFMKMQGYLKEGLRYHIINAAKNEKIIVFVCHAGVILTLLSKLLHIPLPVVYSHFDIDPSSRTSLRTEEKDGYAAFRLESLNDTSHARNTRTKTVQQGFFNK